MPLNVSLDLGLRTARVEQLSNDEYTRTLDSHVIQWSQGPTTLGHKTMVTSWVQVEKRERALLILRSRMRRLVAIQEDQAGELGLQLLCLKYYKWRALKCLMKAEPYYPYPSIESSYCTCDTRLTDVLTDA